MKALEGAATGGTGALREYWSKRDFHRTPEPSGQRSACTAQALQYCIQRHAARRLHYDFRLEWDGVLKSWAIPKGPSLDPAARRLAVQTEDHPLEYGAFEGTIPTGEYGAGDVLLWDRAPGNLAGCRRRARAGKLHFILHGEKLRGEWLLVRMSRGADEWLLRKIDDDAARAGDGDRILAEQPESVRVQAERPRRARQASRSRLPDFMRRSSRRLLRSRPAARVAIRDQVRRLPHGRVSSRQSAADQPQRQRLDRAARDTGATIKVA
jgi:bifunctional non-homologous end joining protein LigD